MNTNSNTQTRQTDQKNVGGGNIMDQMERNVPMKKCGEQPEVMYCYNNIVNMGENHMTRFTSLRTCDRNKDPNDKNLYCKYYEECVKPPTQEK